MPILKTKNEDFFKKWSPEMAYVLGFFAADGCMIRNNRGAHFVEFQITDKDLLIKIKKLLNSNLKITKQKSLRGNWKDSYRLQIGSKKMFGDLLLLGFTPRKSKSVQLPKIPQKYFNHFVRGYFDGDGNVYANKRKDRNSQRPIIQVRFTSGSEKFLKQLHKNLKECNIINKGWLGYCSGAFRLQLSILDSIDIFRFMYKNADNLFLERKKSIFEKYIYNMDR